MTEHLQKNIRLLPCALAIQKCHVITPLGPTLEHNAAALDAGISAIAPSALTDPFERPYVAAAIADDVLPPLVSALAEKGVSPRQARVLRLAAAALQVETTPLNDMLLLCVPKLEPWEPEDDFSKAVPSWLALQMPAQLDATKIRVYDVGLVSVMVAVQAAAAALQQGHAKCVWVGAVDTLCDRDELDRLDRDKKLVTASRSKGLVAGEAAVFMQLVLAKNAQETALRVTGLAREPQHTNAMMVEQLLSATPLPKPPSLIVPDFNGLEAPMNAWFSVAERVGARLGNPQKMLLPSAQGGYAGVAHGLWLLALAHHLAAQSQQSALVHLGGDDTLAGAALIA